MRIWDLNVELRHNVSIGYMHAWSVHGLGALAYSQIACPPQGDDPHALLLPVVLVPVLDPVFELCQLPLDFGQACVVPQPEGSHTHDGVEPSAESEGVKRIHQAVVDPLYKPPEVFFCDERVQDLGVEIGVGGRQIALDHPIALYSYDARGVVQWRVEGDVRVRMRKARMRWTPGEL